MDYRDEVYFTSAVDPEPAFPEAEYAVRLARIRERMQADGVDCLFLTSPEAMFWVSGYQCEWYQAQSPPQWPAASGIAIHVDHDRYILFDTEREAVLGRIFTCSVDTRYFPRTSLRGVRSSSSTSWRRSAGSAARSASSSGRTGRMARSRPASRHSRRSAAPPSWTAPTSSASCAG